MAADIVGVLKGIQGKKSWKAGIAEKALRDLVGAVTRADDKENGIPGCMAVIA